MCTLSSSRAVTATFILAVASTACGDFNNGGASAAPYAEAGAPGQASGCQPVETRPPNATGQRPAFAGQTRACRLTSSTGVDVTVVAKGLVHPWAVEPLASGDLLVTERQGRLRIVTADGRLGEPIAGLPVVDARGQGGLLDVALSPQFAADRTIYWSFSERREGGNATSVARGVLASDASRLDQVTVLFRAMPAYSGTMHFGSRLAFGPDGMLYVTLGERSDMPMRKHAQQLDSHMGKIIRIAPDGAAPPDNPFVGESNAFPEIWSAGHRNVQAAAFDAEGRFWIVEHGPQGGDELNLVGKGKNYGWPIVTYGEEYSGAPIQGAVTQRSGYEQPVYYWDPVIAPSGAQFYTGAAFAEWKGDLLVGSLVGKHLVRLRLRDNRVAGEERLLADRGQRIRDVREGLDGSLYVVTDEKNGELWRLAPRNAQ